MKLRISSQRSRKSEISDLKFSFLITAGPTREWLDPVRFISNPSSGKMGYALAQAARVAGAQVTLVSGPVALRPPASVEIVRVESAADMARETLARAADADVIICAAAVADWTPAKPAKQKIKKTDNRTPLVLRMKRTVDIAETIGRRKRSGQILIGFAAETERMEEHAQGKLKRKNMDLIVGNDVTRPGAGFGADTNEVVIIDRSGAVERPKQGTKRNLAKLIVQRAMHMLAAARQDTKH